MERYKRIKEMMSLVFSACLVTVFMLAGMPANAQDADDEAVSASEEGEKAEEIVVTGSLIRRKDLTTAAPVAVLEKMELDAAGMASIGDILQNLPSQSNAINIQTNNGGDGSTRINLRGIGERRTLVLVNGRRMPYGGTGANTSVDLNSIPTSVIERVEVLKDGASSTYGSDAIGGVVNIITRKDFEGVEASAYMGTSQHGDGTVYDLAVTAGHKFERGHLMFSAGVYENKPSWAGDRGYSKYDFQAYDWGDDLTAADCPGEIKGNVCVYKGGSSATPGGTVIDRLGLDGSAAYQHVNTLNLADPNSGFWYLDYEKGGIRPFNDSGTSDSGSGDFYNYQPENYLLTPQQRFSLFGQGGYRLHERVRGYFETSYVSRRSDQLLAPEPVFTIQEGITVSGDSYYNPFGRDFIDVRRRMLEGGHRNWVQDIDTIRVSMGLEGSLPGGLGPLSNWHWDLSYMYGRTAGTDVVNGLYYLPRLKNALGPSYMAADGTIQCGTPGGGPVDDGRCVPLDLFGGPGTITQDMLDYIGYTGVARGFNETEGVRALITGDVVEIPFGGTVGLAVGYDYREEKGGNQPNPLVAKGDTTGNKSEPVEGEYFVNEVFGELLVPLVTDAPYVELFELTGSLRYFNYNNFGSDITWKVGARWQVIPDFSIRGTISTAFRAPTVLELYAGNYDDFPYATDPCANVAGSPYRTNPIVKANCLADGIPDTYQDVSDQQRTRRGGNLDLEPETANIYTAGVVFQPSFVEGLTATVDYWYFKIDKSIQTTGITVILSGCYTKQGAARDYFCDLVSRNPQSNSIDYIDDIYRNVGGLETWGVDFQVKYDWKTDYGRFLWNLEGTYTGQYDQINGDDSITEGLGVYDLVLAMPEWRANLGLIWGMDEYSAGISARYFGSFSECQDNNCKPDRAPGADGVINTDDDVLTPRQRRDVDANVTFDLFLAYTLESNVGTTKLTFGVNNVLDADPEWIYNGFTATSDPTAYDFFGRFFYARLSQTF